MSKQQPPLCDARVLDAIADAVCLVDANLTIITHNRTFQSLIAEQFRHMDLVGRSIGEIVPFFSRPAPLEWLDRVAFSGEVLSAREEPIQMADGSTRYWDVQVTPMRDETGNVSWHVVTLRDASERVQIREHARAAESELIHKVELFQAIAQGLGDGVYVVDSDHKLMFLNPTGEQLLGWTKDELCGKEFHRIVHPRRPDGSPLPLEECPETKALRSGRVVRVSDDVFVRKDGSTLPVSSVCAPCIVEEQIVGVIVAFQDISDQKRVEELQARQIRQAALRSEVSQAIAGEGDLREMLQRTAESVVRHLDVAFTRIWLLNPETNVLELQASAGLYTRIDGTYSRIPLGELKIGWIAKENRPHLTNDIPHDPQIRDKAWARRTGMVAFAGYPLRDGHRVLGVIATFARHELPDDTLDTLAIIADTLGQGIERRRAEQDLRAALKREQALLRIGRALANEIELDRVAQVVMDQSRTVLAGDAVEVWLADPVRRELTLLASANIPSRTVEEIRQISFDSPLVSARAARTGEIQIVEDLESFAQRNPTMRSFIERERMRSLLAVPLRIGARLVGVLAVLTRTPRHFSSSDIGFHAAVGDLFAVAIENARLYTALRDTLRIRDEFLAAAAHSLKTPVTSIKGWAEVLMKHRGDRFREQKALATIYQQSDRIADLIEDLLAVIQLRPGLQRLHCEQFDLTELVEQAVERARNAAPQQEITLATTPALVVEADKQLIGNALDHLIENALRRTPDDKPITVSTKRIDSEAVVSIRDSGVAIPHERQSHVFEPFFEPIPSGAAGYTGEPSLGLYLSYAIAAAHGGHVGLKSAPGQGATFSLALPLAHRSTDVGSHAKPATTTT